MYFPTAKSYFSGCGGMDYGLSLAGVNIIQSLEIDPTCCETLRLNFNHSILETDITQKTVLDQPKADIMVGTFPCTKYSTAADIHGVRTGDDLFLHFFRHVALERPEAYIVENVPGMRKFRVVMEALTRLPDYYIRIECSVDTVNWLPQRRPRLILIGTKRPLDIKPPENYRRITLAEILEEEPDMQIPDYVYARLKGKYRDRPIISDPDDPSSVSPTCVAHYAKDVSTRLVKDKRFPEGIRPYTPCEYARLQGFPDSFGFAGRSRDIYRMVGNAVAVPLAEWIGKWIVRYFNADHKRQRHGKMQLPMFSER
jgi:DNA (cytosine-5)-methyltransferase 1